MMRHCAAWMTVAVMLLLAGCGERGTPADRVTHAAFFETQPPAEPGVFDHAESAECRPSVSPMEVRWMEPTGGVGPETGLLVMVPGITPFLDCDPLYIQPHPDVIDRKNLVVAVVYQRNKAFAPPYDFGKYQVVDILRGVGTVLDQYPQLDRRRLYLMGVSGGGLAALQTLQFTPHLWAEVHIHCAITRITLPGDVESGVYTNDPGGGWNSELTFPVERGELDEETWLRFEAERLLRSPQSHAAVAPVYTDGADEQLPAVFMFHGDADEKVDFSHFLKYIATLATATGTDGVSPAPIATLGNWTFMRLAGAGHVYDPVPILNEHFPEAYTRRRHAQPDLAVDAALPPANGHTFRLHGESLTTIRLDVEITREQ